MLFDIQCQTTEELTFKKIYPVVASPASMDVRLTPASLAVLLHCRILHDSEVCEIRVSVCCSVLQCVAVQMKVIAGIHV